MSTPDLFAGAAVDFGTPRPSLARPRRLVAGVESLWAETSPAWADRVARLAIEASQFQAHGLTRGLLWLINAEANRRHGSERQHIRVERIARNWLARLERSHV